MTLRYPGGCSGAGSPTAFRLDRSGSGSNEARFRQKKKSNVSAWNRRSCPASFMEHFGLDDECLRSLVSPIHGQFGSSRLQISEKGCCTEPCHLRQLLLQPPDIVPRLIVSRMCIRLSSYFASTFQIQPLALDMSRREASARAAKSE